MKFKIFVMVFIAVLITSCTKNNEATENNKEVSKQTIIQSVTDEVENIEEVYEHVDYLLEYTTGIISIKDDIRIKLNSSSADFIKLKKVDLSSLLKVKGIKGSYDFKDNLIIFTPDNVLKPDTVLECKIDFSKAFNNVPDDNKDFDFKIRTKKLSFDVTLGDLLLSPGSKENNYNYTGVMEFSDWVEDSKVEKSLITQINKKDIVVKWSHKGNKHSFTINDIVRKKVNGILTIKVNGKELKIDKDFKKEIDILPIGVFTYLKHRVERGSTKVVVINFTSPLLTDQQFSNIVSISGDNNPRISVLGSQLKIYPRNPPKGEVKVTIRKSLKNNARQKLEKDIVLKVVIAQEYPELKMVGSSGIVTGNKALFFPFEAVSLWGVDIRIIEVFENNLVQYLQDNMLAAGTTNLRKVARPIYQGTVSLESDDKNLLTWNRFHINLEDYIDVNPGSVYQVELSYRRNLSLYGDPGENRLSQIPMTNNQWGYKDSKENSNWDYYNSYNYNSNWKDRKDPNKDAYYSDPNKTKRRVVFASNIGIIAKRSDNGDLMVFSTDINSTDYISGAEVTVYDYQQQEIGQGKTDSNGTVKIKVNNSVPFVVKVTKDKDAGYLRLNEGSALSSSTFDTAGSKNPKGLKGYIYGERGVWRPGDKVFLHFILEDSESVIPFGHPIVMTLKDPKGTVVRRIVKKKSDSPIYPFIFETEQESPTGNWTAYVQIGDIGFNKRLMIESVKPNRLKIDLDFGVDEFKKSNSSIDGDLTVNWLHGAPGKNLKAEFSASYTSVPTTFNNYSDYIFVDPSKKISGSSSQFFKGSVDEKGHSKISLKLNNSLKSPGKVKVNFSGKAFEKGGDFSIRNFSMPYSPYETYIGLRVPKGDASRDMLLTDVEHTINIVSLNSDGKPVSKDNLSVELYKIDWKWWWDQSAYSQVPNFVSTKARSLIKSGTVNTKNGEGIWKFSISYPSWGRYYLRVRDGSTGHSTGRVVYIDWPGWAGRSTEGNGGASRLFFSTDRKEYELGGKIKLNFPSSSGGKALISLENGQNIIKTFWTDTEENSTDISIATNEDMFPGAYIHITLIQPKASKKNDRPVRMYGILPITVNNKNSILQPVIKMADTLKPNKNVEIKIKEKNGKGMYYTLSVVDDGLLDLTNFITPNPYSSFFTKEALGVKTWDIYDLIVGDSIKDYGSLLATGGGGGETKDQNKEEVNRFKPVVKVLGPFKLAPGEEKKHNFIMPNYIGSVRTMVTAVTNRKQYGSAEKTTPVKEPLMVLGTMPRVIGPNEKISLPVTVFALDESISYVNVTVRTKGLLKLTGENSKKITFNSPGDQILFFDLETANDLGTGEVIIEAKSGKHSNIYSVKMNITPSNPYMTKNETVTIKSKSSHIFSLNSWGYEGSRSSSIEISSIPAINLNRRLKYLIRYPHGCIEQTTSGVFPQLFLNDLKELTAKDKQKIEKNINAGITRIGLFTTQSGGFAYWPGNTEPNSWGSSYAGHFLVEAEKAGYAVPETLLQNWAEYQKKEAQNFKGNKDLNQAYRLYTLALYGEPEIGAMNRLYENKDLSVQAKWRLASAYGLTGNLQAANTLIKGLNYQIENYKTTSSTYGSSLRDKAMILETYSIMNRDGFRLLKEIAEEMGSDKRYNTQATAYALMALSRYKHKGVGIDAELVIDGKKSTVLSEKSFYSQSIHPNSEIKLTNNSKGSLFVSYITEGIENEGEEVFIKNGLSVETKYIVTNGESIKSLTSGTNFKLKVTVKNLTSSLQEEVALNTLFPGGWEIINNRLGSEKLSESSYEYKDIRDDRVNYYFDLTAGEQKTFIIELNASYAGKYYMPSISAESMYNLEIKNIIPGQWIEVVPAN